MSAEEDRGVCSPCRGTGTVISNLGGQPHEVQCPWCGGSGRFDPGRDAQASAPEAQSGERPEGESREEQ